MQHIHIDALYIIGIALRTTNQNNQSAKDIPQLWDAFYAEQIKEQIPHKVNDTVYVIYTAYESDYTAPYTTIIGCQVPTLDDVPEGMVAHTISAGSYSKVVAKGNLMEGIIINEWIKIWNSPTLDRAYTSDFEVYGPKAQDPTHAEVDLYLAIK
ncbi:GyrI-like domain-containing protein [Myroides odoratus]|uniref:GyrI-like domain-containing protein n=1 Tax=Myroides odoratus TaxID=256 RepID=UPI0039B0EA35